MRSKSKIRENENSKSLISNECFKYRIKKFFFSQEQRLSRIQAAKDALNTAFIKSKSAEHKIKSQKIEKKSSNEAAEQQYHHLLYCLEKTTVHINFLFKLIVYFLLNE